MKKIIIIQSSLRKQSNTDTICREFEVKAKNAWLEVEYIDLRKVNLEFCNGKHLSEYSSDLQKSYKAIEGSKIIIIWMPVYQYSMSGVLKNFIDICGWAFKNKKIWVIVNAGGPNCYMASRDLLDSLYFQYQTVNISPIPYSWSIDFKDWKLINLKVNKKLDELVKNIL